jgi:hypothetical protein
VDTPVKPPAICNWPLKVSEWASTKMMMFAGRLSFIEFLMKFRCVSSCSAITPSPPFFISMGVICSYIIETSVMEPEEL